MAVQGYYSSFCHQQEFIPDSEYMAAPNLQNNPLVNMAHCHHTRRSLCALTGTTVAVFETMTLTYPTTNFI